MKKGFTLVEMLAVIVLLSIVITIAVPTITKLRKKTIIKQNENQILEIETSAVFYAQDTKMDIANNAELNITVKTLIDAGYIKSNVKKGERNCSNNKGCLFNPYNVNLNSKSIKLYKVNNTLIAKYQE